MSGVRDKAQEVLGEGEQLLDEANQLSDNINRELEVRQSPSLVFFFSVLAFCVLFFLCFLLFFFKVGPCFFCLQDLEAMEQELGTLDGQLHEKVGGLTRGLSDGVVEYKVQSAEEHARQLNESAAILDR